MTLPYNRSFNAGRQGEQFLNEEAHRIFTALKNINYKKEKASTGSLFLDKDFDLMNGSSNYLI